MSVSENIYKENLFASVRGTCTHVLHLPPARISQRDLTQVCFRYAPSFPSKDGGLQDGQPHLDGQPHPPCSPHLSLPLHQLPCLKPCSDRSWQQWNCHSEHICVRFDKAGNFSNRADFEEGNLAILCPGKACQGPGQLPQPGTSSGGKILRRPVPAANRCEKEIFCNSCKLRRASGTPCRSWVRRWRRWRSPAPRLWSSHPLNQPSSPLDWTSCKRRHLFYISLFRMKLRHGWLYNWKPGRCTNQTEPV